MFPLLAVTLGSSSLISFIIVAVLIAVGLYFLPRILPMDAQAWNVIRAVVLIVLIVWALRLFL